MKKILFFIAIVSFTSFGMISCSEDDPVMEVPIPNENPNTGQQLKLVPSVLFVKLGREVTFKAMSGKTEITDAVFYVNGESIEGNKYIMIYEGTNAPVVGEIKANVRRAGYIDSEVVTIKFAQPY